LNLFLRIPEENRLSSFVMPEARQATPPKRDTSQ
jgi:hypothetical protein